MTYNQFCDKVVEIMTKSLNRFNNGDTSMTGGLTQLMAIANSPVIDSNSEILFGLNIIELIEKVKSGKLDKWMGDIDYHPNKEYTELLYKSGIKISAAPWKSMFKLHKSNGVILFEYKLGYGNPFIEISCKL